MAEHGESMEKRGGKHHSWMEKMKTALGLAGLGSLTANYLVAQIACATLFPPYMLAGATVAAAYGLLTPSTEKKKSGGGHH